jgi:16S rRNA pseudouridine516 synthase
VHTARPVDDGQLRQLLDGVVLRDDPRPVQAEQARIVGPHQLELTLVQGRYHQVKRMVAAVGNHCQRLHRSRFGGLDLSGATVPGQWHFVDDDTRKRALAF